MCFYKSEFRYILFTKNSLLNELNITVSQLNILKKLDNEEYFIIDDVYFWVTHQEAINKIKNLSPMEWFHLNRRVIP